MAFGRRGPVRRIAVTDTLVCRRRRDRRFDAATFDDLLQQEENDIAPVAHYSAGALLSFVVWQFLKTL